MEAVAAYTPAEAKRFIEGNSYCLPFSKVEGGVVYVKTIRKTEEEEVSILVVPAGVRILPHNHPDVDGKIVTETYETMTIDENGIQKTIREDCHIGGTHEFICKPNDAKPKLCYSIVTATKFFSSAT